LLKKLVSFRVGIFALRPPCLARERCHEALEYQPNHVLRESDERKLQSKALNSLALMSSHELKHYIGMVFGKGVEAGHQAVDFLLHVFCASSFVHVSTHVSR